MSIGFLPSTLQCTMKKTAAHVSGDGSEQEEHDRRPQEQQKGGKQGSGSKREEGESSETCEFFRVAPPAILRRFIDAPATAESFEELQQHASPRDLVLQAAWLVANEQSTETSSAHLQGTGSRSQQKTKRPEAERDEEKEEKEENEREDIKLLTQALRKCMTYDGVLDSLVRDVDLRPVLLGASESSSTLLRRLLSQQIAALIRRDNQGVLLAIEGELHTVLPELLGDVDVGVASDASAALLKLLDSSAGEEVFFSSSLFSKLDKLTESEREVVKIRTLAIFVEAGAKNGRLFKTLQDKKVFEKLLQTFFTDDLLLKINAISLIERLGSYPAGVEFLRSGDIPQKLLRELKEGALDETSSVALVHLLAALLKGHPEMVEGLFEAHDHLLPRTLETYMHACAAVPQEKAELCCALGAWGSIAGSAAGYRALEKAVPGMAEKVTEHFFDETEISALALDAWTHTLTSLPTSDFSVVPESTVTNSVAPQALKVYLERPFGESRVHSYPLLRALSRSKDALRIFFSSTSFRLQLADSFSEDSSEAKYAKNDFLRSLFKEHRSWLTGLLDDEFILRLEELANGGPFYVPPGARVATASPNTAA